MAWSSKLARPIALKGAWRKLVTLRDAGDFLTANFAKSTPTEPLQGAIEELMQAALSDDADDIKIATGQVELFLNAAGLAEPGPRRFTVSDQLRHVMARDARQRKGK